MTSTASIRPGVPSQRKLVDEARKPPQCGCHRDQQPVWPVAEPALDERYNREHRERFDRLEDGIGTRGPPDPAQIPIKGPDRRRLILGSSQGT